jgi:hypothetical protein
MPLTDKQIRNATVATGHVVNCLTAKVYSFGSSPRAPSFGI